ncbi:unnamed protein product [Ostreobium quekettii]|uniref:Uncharacterized protein n=1 Tax=Ostreobium quekettii TaxID=121088 RepID=A0A8S1J2N6_9CHLO|nr:unnamed protein product [Ostreobium quekettii]|eukprot:evm.model.scf_1890.2 EVM.evm.TU.scf_1890.2   scf_1890:5400-9451(-)
MPPLARSPAGAFLAALLLLALPGALCACENSALLALGDVSDGFRSLFTCDTAVGSLSPGGSYPLRFAVPEVEGRMPDVMITLRTVGGEGDADLLCSSVEELAGAADAVPGVGDAAWASRHAGGEDFVFISSESESYRVLQLPEVNASVFACAVIDSGRSPTDERGIDFELEVDVDYSRRSLNADERDVLNSIYEQCCQGEACREWTQRPPDNASLAAGQFRFLDFCHWQPNVCDSKGFLLRLSMRNLGLDCQLPASQIAKLSRLRKLELDGNRLTGDINALLGELKDLAPRLEHLGLRDNGLGEGSLEPTPLGDAVCDFATASLSFLDLSNNSVAGPIPDCLFLEDSALAGLHMADCPIGAGLPDAFSAPKLQALTLSNSQLTGPLPASLSQAAALRILDLSGNGLTGSIPPDLGARQPLVLLDLSSNRLEGPVPDGLAASQTLTTLLLNGNRLTALPAAWTVDSEALEVVDLAENNITGTFPTSLARAPNIRRFSIAGNGFTGTLAAVGGLLPAAADVNLSRNHFEGGVPDAWATLGMFAAATAGQVGPRRSPDEPPPALDLSHNALSGGIPLWLVQAAESTGAQVLLNGNEVGCPPGEEGTVFGVDCSAAGAGGQSPASAESGASAKSGESADPASSGGSAVLAESVTSAPGGGGASSSSSAAAGAVAGVVAGLVAVAAAAAGYAYWRVRRRRSRVQHLKQTDSLEDAFPPDVRGGYCRFADAYDSSGTLELEPPAPGSRYLVRA